MFAKATVVSLPLAGMVFFCSSCSSVPVAGQELAAPAAIDYCNITLSFRKAGETATSTWKMGEQAPMPKLKVFTYKPTGRLAEISFDGVGEHCAIHFNGTMLLSKHIGNTYTFRVHGEMKGFEGESRKDFTATPSSITITLNPEE